MIRVIIVEDDNMVAEVNKMYVNSVEGFLVKEVFNSSREAFDYLCRNKIDLVLLDVYMPGMDGMKFLEELRLKEVRTDVIMVTAAHDVEHIHEALRSGVVDYLIKPFEYERIKKSLLLYKKRYDLLREKKLFVQEDIDTLMVQKNQEMNILKKGLHENTLEIIEDFMKNNVKEFTNSEELSEKLRMSKVTIRRYLDYLEFAGRVTKEMEYGTVGRPGYLYKYNRETIN